jgi:hypothetical protein
MLDVREELPILGMTHLYIATRSDAPDIVKIGRSNDPVGGVRAYRRPTASLSPPPSYSMGMVAWKQPSTKPSTTNGS